MLFRIIDLTELEEMAEGMESQGSHVVTDSSQDRQTTCPVCQQLFSETYIAIHAANCELHVDKTAINTGSSLSVAAAAPSSSRLHQTTLTHKRVNTYTQRKRALESDSDAEVVCDNL